MTSKVIIRHGGGSHDIGVFNEATGAQVATLKAGGEEFIENVYDGQQFSVREIGSAVTAPQPVGPTPAAPNPDGDPVTDEFAKANEAHHGRKLPGER
jgi:hypothetical protein